MYLVVSPFTVVSCAPSLRTAIKNWYKHIDASMATLRPVMKYNNFKHFFYDKADQFTVNAPKNVSN